MLAVTVISTSIKVMPIISSTMEKPSSDGKIELFLALLVRPDTALASISPLLLSHIPTFYILAKKVSSEIFL
jgi:hypothetical protein